MILEVRERKSTKCFLALRKDPVTIGVCATQIRRVDASYAVSRRLHTLAFANKLVTYVDSVTDVRFIDLKLV